MSHRRLNSVILEFSLTSHICIVLILPPEDLLCDVSALLLPIHSAHRTLILHSGPCPHWWLSMPVDQCPKPSASEYGLSHCRHRGHTPNDSLLTVITKCQSSSFILEDSCTLGLIQCLPDTSSALPLGAVTSCPPSPRRHEECSACCMCWFGGGSLPGPSYCLPVFTSSVSHKCDSDAVLNILGLLKM